jgi:hypothetical protein
MTNQDAGLYFAELMMGNYTPAEMLTPCRVPCFWVAALEVIDQLCQVFNGVDVVVGRGADQADTRGAVTGHCDVTSHLLARQLTTLSWLSTLQHEHRDATHSEAPARLSTSLATTSNNACKSGFEMNDNTRIAGMQKP